MFTARVGRHLEDRRVDELLGLGVLDQVRHPGRVRGQAIGADDLERDVHRGVRSRRGEVDRRGRLEQGAHAEAEAQPPPARRGPARCLASLPLPTSPLSRPSWCSRNQRRRATGALPRSPRARSWGGLYDEAPPVSTITRSATPGASAVTDPDHGSRPRRRPRTRPGIAGGPPSGRGGRSGRRRRRARLPGRSPGAAR